MTPLPQSALDLIEAKFKNSDVNNREKYICSLAAQWALTDPEVLREAGMVRKDIMNWREDDLIKDAQYYEDQLTAAQNKIIELEGKLNEK